NDVLNETHDASAVVVDGMDLLFPAEPKNVRDQSNDLRRWIEYGRNHFVTMDIGTDRQANPFPFRTSSHPRADRWAHVSTLLTEHLRSANTGMIGGEAPYEEPIAWRGFDTSLGLEAELSNPQRTIHLPRTWRPASLQQ
ncbi:MAG TPA: hypothetical protein PKE27_10225, partial [Povalibacter sp.]|uniref:hypothetical protein n=1 Tax=Povalibacter sp. TaxID=1962978 RepID=UPI002C8E81B8